jgi:hypothetical protein
MSDYRDWKVGDKVVCVVDEWPRGCVEAALGVLCPLVSGAIYTVASLTINGGVGIDGLCDKKVCVHLDEVRHPTQGGSFDARRFRKIEPRKTDISIFTAMLNRTDVREEA